MTIVTGTIYLADNLQVLRALPDGSVDLIYVDPPFNTGKSQQSARIRTVPSPDGDRTGFQGKRYRTTLLSKSAFDDAFADYLSFLRPRLEEAHRVLAPRGSLYIHLDYREVHYVKVELDGIFGRSSFINEIIWAYDYGARTRKRWPPKHDNILLYAKSPTDFRFNYEEIERIPYMAH